MSAAREDILRRIAAIERAPAPSPPRTYRRSGTLDHEDRVSLFCERVTEYRAHVVRTDNPPAAIAQACSARKVRRLGVPPGLPGGWRPVGVDVVEDEGLTTTALDALDGALTGCRAGIAETGTLVLAAGEHEGRRALSLVPDLHICVIAESQIIETVPEAIALLAHGKQPMTFISGPSATSDIELSRVEGVHGPRNLVVVVASGCRSEGR